MITYTSVKSPVFVNEEQTLVLCKVKFDHLPEEVEFLAAPFDTEPHAVEIYSRIIAGDFGLISSYVAPTAE